LRSPAGWPGTRPRRSGSSTSAAASASPISRRAAARPRAHRRQPRGIVDQAKTALPQAEIVIELGRYFVGEAGLYVAKVLDKKVSRGLTYLVTDGGLHHHLSASGNFGQVIRKNYPAAIANRMDRCEMETVSVVGPLCTPLDLLADRMSLPAAEPGDLVAIYQSGAYGATASPQRFLGHPGVVEVLV
jgi:Diaminopimelate decarboxylase